MKLKTRPTNIKDRLHPRDITERDWTELVLNVFQDCHPPCSIGQIKSVQLCRDDLNGRAHSHVRGQFQWNVKQVSKWVTPVLGLYNCATLAKTPDGVHIPQIDTFYNRCLNVCDTLLSLSVNGKQTVPNCRSIVCKTPLSNRCLYSW